MAHDLRIQELTQEVLAERGLPTTCTALLDAKTDRVEIKLGPWAKLRYRKTRFLLKALSGLDAYDKQHIESELDGLPVKSQKA